MAGIGSRVRRAREIKGWSLAFAAARWATSTNTISRVERGLHLPSIPLAAKIYRDTGIKPIEWAGEKYADSIAVVA